MEAFGGHGKGQATGQRAKIIKAKENAMANTFWVSVRNNISKRWNTTENDVSKNQSSADSAIRLPNTSILNSNAADKTEYFLDVAEQSIGMENVSVLSNPLRNERLAISISDAVFYFQDGFHPSSSLIFFLSES
ncbi:hypothetical protein TNCV_4573971 [Trichonephila clavipes]|nr:hypothetical protein TNCV_4573971 [Trichonephila clavipes]